MSDSQIDALRANCAEPLDHPRLAQLWLMSQWVVDATLDDFGSLAELDPAVTATRNMMESLLRCPPPELGSNFRDVLTEFRTHVAPHNMRPSHPRFLGFVPGAPTYLSMLGDWLCSACNLFAGHWNESAGAAQIEILVLDWFKELMDFPPEAEGLFTSGGSEANLTALTVARQPLSRQAKQLARLYTSDQRHWSIDRAMHILGFEQEQIRVLPTGPDYRLAPDRLQEAVHLDRQAGAVPWAVVAHAGTTNTGAIDPLDSLANVCLQEQLWFHVDAAYGWPAILTEQGKADMHGITRADSVTLDAHKWLAQTYVAGCLLVRRPGLLKKTFGLRPEYLRDLDAHDDEVNFADRGLALTRRFQALKIWLSFKVLGVSWYRRLVEHNLRLAELMQLRLMQERHFEIVSPRQLSTLCFRFAPPGRTPTELDELNQRLCDAMRQTGRVFLATTRLRQHTVLRVCFVNWRTTSNDVEEVVRLLVECAERCVQS